MKGVDSIPMVSVITPCYNGACYIAECIESVLAQSYPYWEMIVIDDCSSDNSSEIINQYVNKDNRIIYCKTSKPSGSPACPRNIGLEKARGKYIAFLDCDDVWLSTKLERQIMLMDAYGYSFVYSNYEKMRVDGFRSNRIVRVRNKTSYKDALKSCSIPCLTAIIKREIIGTVKFENVNKEDYVFWLNILKLGSIAYNTNTVEAIYRVAPNSRSSDKINMIKYQWCVLRHVEHINIFKSVYYMIIFIILGLYKYII